MAWVEERRAVKDVATDFSNNFVAIFNDRYSGISMAA
jgi:hypothetical protein